MPTNIDQRCLIVALGGALTLADNVSWPIERFRLSGVTYRDQGLGNWTGFYDWLRRADGEIVGVRYCPLADNIELFEAARMWPYARIEHRCLEIYFSGVEQIDDARSCDQEFLYDPLFRSDSGTWALAFDTTALTQSELGRLRQRSAASYTTALERDS